MEPAVYGCEDNKIISNIVMFRLKTLTILGSKAELASLPEGKSLINTINAHSFNIAKKDSLFAAGVIMNYIKPRLVLLVCAILTFVATLIVVVCSGTLSLIAFFALYLGESIMFPTIFSLALRDAGTKTKLASSLLIMTIVGGAIAPVIMGYIADTTGSMAIAFLIPLVCYGVIGGYAAMPRYSSTGV